MVYLLLLVSIVMPTVFKTMESRMLPPITSGLAFAKRQIIPTMSIIIPERRHIVPRVFIRVLPLLFSVVFHTLNVT